MWSMGLRQTSSTHHTADGPSSSARCEPGVRIPDGKHAGTLWHAVTSTHGRSALSGASAGWQAGCWLLAGGAPLPHSTTHGIVDNATSV